MLLKINDKIINMDRVAMVQRKDGGTVWINFHGSGKGTTDLTLSVDEGTKLWLYLRTKAKDVISFEIDQELYPLD